VRWVASRRGASLRGRSSRRAARASVGFACRVVRPRRGAARRRRQPPGRGAAVRLPHLAPGGVRQARGCSSAATLYVASPRGLRCAAHGGTA
jgi:hypothetical protein